MEYIGQDAAAIEKYLCRRKVNVLAYDTVDSTNNVAKKLLADGAQGEYIITAQQQTAGRGRQGKSFFSPKGRGAYFTLIMYPMYQGGQAADFTLVTSAMAAAVSQSIDAVFGVRTQIKWVNDIYLDGKKICGILAEAVVKGFDTAIVVGIGINITTDTEDFPEELKDKAGSLGKSVDSGLLIAQIADRAFSYCDNLQADDIIPYCRERSCVIGKEIVFFEGGREYKAFAEDIDSRGGLVVRLENGEKRVLRGGEISVRI